MPDINIEMPSEETTEEIETVEETVEELCQSAIAEVRNLASSALSEILEARTTEMQRLTEENQRLLIVNADLTGQITRLMEAALLTPQPSPAIVETQEPASESVVVLPAAEITPAEIPEPEKPVKAKRRTL